MIDYPKCEIAKFIETKPTSIKSIKGKLISKRRAYYGCGFHGICNKPDKDKWPECRGRWAVALLHVLRQDNTLHDIIIKGKRVR